MKGGRFFKDDQFDFETRIALGGTYRRAAEAGEVVATTARIADGDAESWYREWTATGERILAVAGSCEASGHRVSARDAYLRAAAYLFTATASLDGTDDPDRLPGAWRVHRAAWDRFCALSDPPIERVAIPYEDTELTGYLFRPRAGGPRPAIILSNGSDGPVHATWIQCGAAAVERGYLAITVDGPGQGQALLEQGIPFRPDWEAVIAPVVDHLLARDEAGRGDRFDRDLALGLKLSPGARRTLAFRMRPYGLEDPYDTFQAVRGYHLRDVVGRIECPVLVTDPDDEQFWPGQSRELYDALRGERTLIRFTREEGAGHCEPMAPGLRDQRIFDWLDETLGAG